MAEAAGLAKSQARNKVWVPGGSFLMGPEDFYPEERPVRRVEVDGFWIDERPVTVAQFRRFVRETGHGPLPAETTDPGPIRDRGPDVTHHVAPTGFEPALPP